MDAKASVKFIRLSPRKARLVADVIRGYEYPEAVDFLRFLPQKGARLILKVVEAARANAEVQDDNLEDKDLFVKKIYIDKGPIMYRFLPRARGRATKIRKRLSHITVVLSDD